MNKKILIVTPRSPFEGRGADEQDRLSGIEWFIKKGFQVRVITKTFGRDVHPLEESAKKLGIKVIPVSYKFGKKNIRTIIKRLSNPLYWDGAAYEYFDPEIQIVLKEELAEFKPDFVWFDYTYLWPLYDLVNQCGTKIITRSINFEPTHFLDEDGRAPWNYLRALPKYMSEWKSFRKSNYFLAITPKEERMYRKFGNIPVATLPLRSLPARIGKTRRGVQDGKIHIGFMSSTYTVHHNLEALRFMIKDVLPLIDKETHDKIQLHVTGNKLPEDVKKNLPGPVIYEGFVPSSIEFWLSMDIALVPSIFGAGMQQKIFEPLTLGLPTITSKRGLADYPFECGENVICAANKEEFARALIRLVKDVEYRNTLGNRSKKIAEKIFNAQVLDEIIEKALLS